MNYKRIIGILAASLIVASITLVLVSWTLASLPLEGTKCFDGVFMEQLQPDVPTTYVQRVWLCGVGMHYEFIEPNKDRILNRRDINANPVY